MSLKLLTYGTIGDNEVLSLKKTPYYRLQEHFEDKFWVSPPHYPPTKHIVVDII